MAYQSLYRTWRPRRFQDMVGQEAIVQALKNQAESGRVAHAYLFCGSRGTGKTSAARIMAMAINCKDPQDGNPCLVCENCLALSSETTLDVFEMDAASNSRVEEIREMLTKTDYPPQFVKYKVYIIDEVHMLSNAAFNALLKTLEEPPDYMVFILATTEPQKLPATVLSRCQRFDFGRLTESAIMSRLQLALTNGVSAEKAALQMIAASAEGSMRDAWSLMDMCLSGQEKLTEENVREALGAVSLDFLFDFLDALQKGDAAQALLLCDQLMRKGRDVQVFLRDFNSHLRQLICVKWTGNSMREVTSDQIEKMRGQVEDISTDMLLHMLEKCMQAENDARWAASPRAILELFALRVCQISQENDLGALLARLSRVENQLTALSNGPVQQAEPLSPDEPRETPPQPGEALQSEDSGESEKPPQAEQTELPIAPEEARDTQQASSAPPESPVADAAIGTDKKSPKDAWNHMLERLNKLNPGLHAMLHRGKFGGFKGEVFSLSLPPEDAFLSFMLNNEERTSLISNLLSEEMGRPVSFTAGSPDRAAKKSSAPLKDENIDTLAEVFGRDKVIVKREPD